MSRNHNQTVNKIAKTGARTIGGLILLVLKIIGTFVLIGVTTLLIFACIFAIYAKSNLIKDLDVSLNDFKMSLSSIIYYEDPDTGSYKELVTLEGSEYRLWVDYADIPEYMEQALVAIEDKRFYNHHGVDWYRTVAAFGNMFLKMKDNFGGSTITQQLIKNLTEEDEVTVQRKLQEIFRALEFEKEYEKDQIVEWYLNVVTFGGNCYGIGAAANYYFGKDVSDLSLAECASILAITNNPSLYNPYINEEGNKNRQEDILGEMYYTQRYIDQETYERAVNEKLNFVRGTDEKKPTVVYTYFEDAIIEDVIADLMELKDCSYKVAEQLLYTNGYRIYSTLDPTIQSYVDSIYTNLEEIPVVTGSDQQIQSAIVIADPETGHIVALSGGVGEKTLSRSLNRATQSTRPPGSSIKPLSVYGPALEYGLITPDMRFEDSADVTLSGTDWMPKNDDWSYSGVINIRTAVIRSKNTIAAQVVDLLTPERSYAFMTEVLGFDYLSPYDADYAPMALGQLTYGITVRDMVSGYTMFVNNGVEQHTITYTKLLDNDFELIYENTPMQTVAISDVTAYWMTNLLQDAVKYGTGRGANINDIMSCAGKTGTTTDKKDRWFAGYTPYYVAVVWTGYDTPATMTAPGGNPAAALWKKVMTLVHQDLPYAEFSKPEDTYLKPIPGVDPEVGYTVRGVTVDGEVLYETSDTAIKGKNITAQAAPLEAYELVGAAEKTITITDEPANNVIEFFYTLLEVEPSVDPSADPSADPSTDPSADPSTDPSADPSTDPSADPSTDPSADPSTDPSTDPSEEPSADPSTEPSTEPSEEPSPSPSPSPPPTI